MPDGIRVLTKIVAKGLRGIQLLQVQERMADEQGTSSFRKQCISTFLSFLCLSRDLLLTSTLTHSPTITLGIIVRLYSTWKMHKKSISG